MSRTDLEQELANRVYSDHRLRARVAAEMRKRSDVGQNGIMLILAETYLDGVRDGDGFGLESTCREAYRD